MTASNSMDDLANLPSCFVDLPGLLGGLYSVGPLPESCGAGVAAACTATATKLAFEHGARAITITLQASHKGENIYRRLGYREYACSSRWSR